MNENLTIIKGKYIIKQPRKQPSSLPVCPVCQACTHKEQCENRDNIQLMKACEDCKACNNKEVCDKFYLATQYRARIIFGIDPFSKKKIEKVFSGMSEEEVIYKAMQFRTDYFNGIIDVATMDQPSIYQIVEKHEKQKYDDGEIRASTYVRNMYSYKRFFDHPWAHIPISKVKKSDLEIFLKDCRLYANSTIKKVYEALKRAYSIAISKHYVRESFFVGEDAIKVPISLKDDKEVYAMTLEEEGKFINYIVSNGIQHKNIFLLALYTGMRIGEILALTEKDIDFKKNVLTIDKTVTKDVNYKDCIGKTKTSNGKRRIIINELARPVLEESVAEKIPNELNLLFCTEKGNIINRESINSVLRRVCQRIKIRNFSTHALRHTFATRCVEAGMNFKALQGFMGHADIQTTLDTYAELQDNFKKSEMQKLDEYMKIE